MEKKENEIGGDLGGSGRSGGGERILSKKIVYRKFK